MKISKEKIEFYAKILDKMKAESDKRNEIYKHGVDLINYENGYINALLEVLDWELDGIKDEIGWWLWEDVKKVYTFKGVDYDVKNAKDFLKFNLIGVS